MRRPRPRVIGSALIVALADVASSRAPSDDKPPSSYLPVVSTEDVATVMARMRDAKPEVIGRQRNLLDQRYDLSDRPGKTMSLGKPVQDGLRVHLSNGLTWDERRDWPSALVVKAARADLLSLEA